jgi:hypothetical protein
MLRVARSSASEQSEARPHLAMLVRATPANLLSANARGRSRDRMPAAFYGPARRRGALKF